jgi:hypothetical protein
VIAIEIVCYKTYKKGIRVIDSDTYSGYTTLWDIYALIEGVGTLISPGGIHEIGYDGRRSSIPEYKEQNTVRIDRGTIYRA